ncbi:AzlC family ABC transporter permease [Brevibacillus fluminis]|uniref:AzlC family ABC transporter permease n=1 Tax=Brevibacillus fluminis TaxID=511487 RepID=UPI003F8943B1
MIQAKPAESKWAAFREGVVDALPMVFSFVIFGGIFGLLATNTGLLAWQSVAMSLVVFAGSAQFTALSMLGEHTGLVAIIIATFLLNSRHLLMGLSMSPYYKSYPTKHVNMLAFLFIDESYAITLNRFRTHPSNMMYVYGTSLALYATWVGGTWLGTVAGKWLPDPASLGLGFSFSAMFLALVYYQLYSPLRIVTFVACGGAAVVLAFILPNGLHLLAAGLLAFGIGYFLGPKQETAPSEENLPKGVESA